MSGWIAFWKYACIAGIGAFYALVLAVIPLGARDIARLLRDLARGKPREGRGQTR